MRGTISRLWRFLISSTIALSLGGAAIAETRPGTGATSAAGSGSVPIELPAAPATPSPNEVVGGFFLEFFVVLGVLLFIGVMVVVILEASHHHVIFECEECHHHAPPPQRAQIPPPPPDPAPRN
jgi:hypothetical protein